MSYTADGQDIECGSWGSFAEGGMLGNNMGATAFVERYPTIQLSECLFTAGILNSSYPLPGNPTNPGAGPACRPVPADIKLDTSMFTITMTTSYSGTEVATLTPQQVDMAVTAAPTYWVWEESYINLPNGLNMGLPPC